MLNAEDLRSIVEKHGFRVILGMNETQELVLARAVAVAVKRDDAKRCDMYIRLLNDCGYAAAADEVRHLQRHFNEDADDFAGKGTT